MTTAITPNATSHAQLAPLASRLVQVGQLPWERTKFAGVETKTLVIDKPSGLLTVLMRMAPGAILPDHQHALIEQTYVLEGRLVDLEGPDAGLSVGPGDFVWRPAGSRHSAWAPDGGLMLAIFQVPNRFFEPDGGVVDMLGQNWEENWRSAVT
ncbi:cupin domain-containing protein [Zeimonas arvi]|uniref:Cupin domain-containing protein n=1 Tax=Zeimonas arvi TaxID=2498847 RepID=A0A5C8NYI9_9BURK|nr:cupin domain-containing protein [Zeimonas arvi]TXL66206.1 cupin domain-containing protein [Zeimonas arvi]